jgi:hypothetical protein
MTKASNHKEYLEKVFNLVGNEYEILEGYVKSNIKLLTKHNVCGTLYYVSPNKFLIGRRCPFCRYEVGKNNKKNIAENRLRGLKEKISDIDNGDFCFVDGEYSVDKSFITVLHISCNRTFRMVASNFLTKQYCPLCKKEATMLKHHKTHEQFIKDMYDTYGNEYEVLGTYINSKTHVLIKHICGYKWNITPSNILGGYGCPECDRKRKQTAYNKTQETFEKEVEIIGYGEYEVIGKYETNGKKISIKHKICGRVYDVLPGNFLRGDWCPYCHCRSKGEKRIHQFFKAKNIHIEKNYTFKNCRRKNALSFDVGFYREDGQLVLIEYNGSQHYFMSEFFGGEKKFKEQQENDATKIKYCADNNIPLIIIPYWEYDNIEKILEQELLSSLERR